MEQASISQMKPLKTASLVLQVDNHIAELTVRETLDFAARVLGVGHKAGAQITANLSVLWDASPLVYLPAHRPGSN